MQNSLAVSDEYLYTKIAIVGLSYIIKPTLSTIFWSIMFYRIIPIDQIQNLHLKQKPCHFFFLLKAMQIYTFLHHLLFKEGHSKNTFV